MPLNGSQQFALHPAYRLSSWLSRSSKRLDKMLSNGYYSAMHETQRKLLEYIDKNDTTDKSLRQIARDIGEKQQPQLIKHHIDQLIRRGLINLSDSRYKRVEAYSAAESDNNLVSIPILGTANCGPAELFAEENLEGYIKISRSLIPKAKSLFALRAVGASMNNADISGDSINDGDYVIIDPDTKDIRDGSYVLSVIDGLANIKRFYRDVRERHILLRSESTSDYPPIVIDPNDIDYAVNGKVIKVIKT